jgi:UDP-N-acetyl-D-mannosaminuronate dehydrogenase
VNWTVVVGLGEVGAPLLELIRGSGRPAVGIDVESVEWPQRGSVDVMHICFPFEIENFVGEVARYVDAIEPRLTVINSTVSIGTTRAIHERTGARIAHSPVRGKHARMLEELGDYAKFVGALGEGAGREIVEHFESLGLRTRLLSSPEATELAKLTETTYFGLLIAWAQEVERYCDRLELDYAEIASFYEEVQFFPQVTFFPGVIGGHCVMPNIEILRRLEDSPLLNAIRESNARKVARDGETPTRVAAGVSRSTSANAAAE